MGRGQLKEKKDGLYLSFFPAPRDFLIDFQGYALNLFFRYRGLVKETPSQCFLSNFTKFGPLWNFASDP